MELEQVDGESVTESFALEHLSVEQLEAAESRVRLELREVDEALKLPPVAPFSTRGGVRTRVEFVKTASSRVPCSLPLRAVSEMQLRSHDEMKALSEADLLQEVINANVALLFGELRRGGGRSLSAAQAHLLSPAATEYAVELERLRGELERAAEVSRGVTESGKQRYCLCQLPYNGDRSMISCDSCQEWFHFTCVGLPIDHTVDVYYCPLCQRESARDDVFVFATIEELLEHGAVDLGADRDLIELGEVPLILKMIETQEEIDSIQEALDLHEAQVKEEKRAKSLEKRKHRMQEKKSARSTSANSDVTLVDSEQNGEAVLEELRGLMAAGFTQSKICAESKLPGGQTSLSALLQGRQVAKRDDKLRLLSEWLEELRDDVLLAPSASTNDDLPVSSSRKRPRSLQYRSSQSPKTQGPYEPSISIDLNSTKTKRTPKPLKPERTPRRTSRRLRSQDEMDD